jgi:hypothetical protein
MSHASLVQPVRSLLLAASVAATALPLLPAGTVATTLDVCLAGCTYTELAPALAAARDGDTITVGAGTYHGGLVISTSVKVVGAGAGKTIIKGGGPVITIGTYLATKEPTVSIRGLTVTGGVNHTSPMSNDWVGAPNVIAAGGGIAVMPSADFGGGATVRITDSVITGNRVVPTATQAVGPPCPGGPCSFAWARGGGIDTFGDLTLVRTTVSDNLAAGVASDADGAGIDLWWTASLTMRSSRVTGNRAVASAPNGRYAEGGGIFTDEHVTVSISDSTVSNNLASLTSTLPYDVGGGNTLDMNANGGGLHIGGGSTVSIARTAIDGNTVSASDPNGRPYAFDAGMNPGDGPVKLRDGSVSGNHLVLHAASSEDVGPSGSALDLGGKSSLSGMRIVGNTASVTSADGLAWATGGAVYVGGESVIAGSVISGNTTTATAHGGAARVWGGAVTNDGTLTLRDTLVKGNTATALGASGEALGGGVYSGPVFASDPPTLKLDGATITLNRVKGGPGITLQGGGVYSTSPVTITGGSSITGNQPDDCAGC